MAEQQKQDNVIIHGYWDVRGLGNPIRYLLTHVNANWEEKLYTCGPPPEFSRENWLQEKFNLGLDFPNLPYLIDGDVKLTQSGVIMDYLAHKFDLIPKDLHQKARAKLLQAQIYDYHMEYARMVYGDYSEEARANYLSNIDDKLKLLTAWIKGKKFAMGDQLTYVDFYLFEYLEGQQFFSSDVLNCFPELKEYHDRMTNLDSIKKYFSSEKAIKFPFNGAPAKFGGAYSDQIYKKH